MGDGRQGAQERTFTRWCNHFLSERMMKIDDLFADLQDGIYLHSLIEIISGKRIGKVNKNPKMSIQKIENLNKTLTFLKNEGLKMVNIGPKDIHDGTPKCILGLIWTLILRYQIQSGGSDGSPKRTLLKWINKQVRPYKLEAIDFTKSFQDGKILCALTDSLQKGCINPGERGANLSQDPVQDCDTAIQKAEELFEIPALIAADDVVNNPDDLSMMTYVSYFRDFAANRKKMAGDYAKYGPSPVESYATGRGVEGGFSGRPLDFTIYALNCDGAPANNPKHLGEWIVKVKGPKGELKCDIQDNKDGTVSGQYSPTCPGDYEVEIKLKNPKQNNAVPEDIKGSVYTLKVKEGGDPAKSYAEGPGLDSAFDDAPANFTVYVKDKNGQPVIGEYDLTVDITPKGSVPMVAPKFCESCGQKLVGNKFCESCGWKIVKRPADGSSAESYDVPGSAIEPKIKDNGDGSYYVEYEADQPGDYTLNVAIAGTPIKDMPRDLQVCPGADPNKTYAEGPGVKSPGFAGLPHPFTIFCVDPDGKRVPVGGQEFIPVITGPNGKEVNLDLVDNKDGTWSGCYTPDKIGDYIVDLKMKKKGKMKGIKDNPFKIKVKEPADCSKTYAEGPGIEYAVDNRPNTFTVFAKDKNNKPVTGLTEGDWITVKLTDPKEDPNGEGESKFPARIKDNNDGTYDVEYDADVPGDYVLNVMIGDQSIKDMPKEIHCYPGVDAANTVVTGPGVEKGLPDRPLEFTIQAKDKDGNNVPVGGDEFRANIVGPDGNTLECDIKDNGDGTYTGLYEPKAPGKYEITLEVNDDDNKVGNSPYTCIVGSGADPGSSYCKGPGWKYAYDNTPTHFTVYCFDAEGKPVSGEIVKVKMIQIDDAKQKSILQTLISKVDKYMLQKKDEEDKKWQIQRAAERKEKGLPPIEETDGDVMCDIFDNGDGTYRVEYCPRLPGTYKTSVTVGPAGSHVKKSPKNIPVRWRCPNAPCAHTQQCMHTEIRELNDENELLKQKLRELGHESFLQSLEK